MHTQGERERERNTHEHTQREKTHVSTHTCTHIHEHAHTDNTQIIIIITHKQEQVCRPLLQPSTEQPARSLWTNVSENELTPPSSTNSLPFYIELKQLHF